MLNQFSPVRPIPVSEHEKLRTHSMRVLLLTLLLVAGSQADFLTDLGDAFSNTFNQLVDQGKEVGQNLLDSLKVTGAQLASQGLQALMLNVADALTSTDTTASPQKRQLSADPLDPDGVIFNHADELRQYMQVALNATHRLEHPETYQQTIQDFLDHIDQVVAHHGAQKRQLGQLGNLAGMVTARANELKGYLQTALSALSGLADQLGQPETYENFQTFLDNVDQVVADHGDSVDAVVQGLVQEVTSLLPHDQDKRALVDSLGAVGQGLSQVVQPHVDLLKTIVGSVGDVLKSAASQLFGTLMSSVNNLGTQLVNGDHMTAIQQESAAVAQNGQDAVSALKDTVSDILQQTMANMQPHLSNIAGHVLSALAAGRR